MYIFNKKKKIRFTKKMLMWKIVERSKASVIYIYIYIDYTVMLIFLIEVIDIGYN